MPYAINLFFDAATEDSIRSIWEELAGIESAAYLHQSGARPHIKLAVYQTLRLDDAEQRLLAVAADADTMPVIFKHAGVFPNPRPTLFWGLVVTMPLLKLQQQVREALANAATGLSLDYFAAGQWVPHCLLALDIDPEQLTPVLNIGMQLTLPFAGEIQRIGVVEFRPPKLLCDHPLRQRQPHPEQQPDSRDSH